MIDSELHTAFEQFKRDTRLQVELQAELEWFKRDTRYAEEHRRELLEQYPEQWVAVYNEQVVGAGPDYLQLLSELKARGVPLNHTFFKYCTRKKVTLIL